MINIKEIIDDIFNIITKKQTIFEIILNLSFILIIFIITGIFYWDSINRSIINNSRCKVSMNNSDLTYNVSFMKDNTNIYNISYDNTSDKNIKIDCTCPIGETINTFDISYYNQKDQKLEQINKYCYCDKTYSYDMDGKKKLQMEGDAFLVDYYKTLYNSESIENLGSIRFPS